MMRSDVSFDLHGRSVLILSQEMSPAAMMAGKLGVGAGVGTGVGPSVTPPPHAWRRSAPASSDNGVTVRRNIGKKGEGYRFAGEILNPRTGTGRRMWAERGVLRWDSPRFWAGMRRGRVGDSPRTGRRSS